MTPTRKMKNVIQIMEAHGLNGWKWDHQGLGTPFGGAKSRSFTLQLTKEVWGRVRRHEFLIQAVFDPKDPFPIITWLSQGGQIITFGARSYRYPESSVRPESNDEAQLDAFLEGIKKSTEVTDEALLETLYASKYERYGTP